jgi:hypothetical protein
MIIISFAIECQYGLKVKWTHINGTEYLWMEVEEVAWADDAADIAGAKTRNPSLPKQPLKSRVD